MLTKRDQYTNEQLPIDDCALIIGKHNQHLENHPYSEKAKAKKPANDTPEISVGDLVYLTCDPVSKGTQRSRYIVAKVDGEWCNVRKLTETQLRSMAYRVKKNQCYLVPCYKHPKQQESKNLCDSTSEDVEEVTLLTPQSPARTESIPYQEPTTVTVTEESIPTLKHRSVELDPIPEVEVEASDLCDSASVCSDSDTSDVMQVDNIFGQTPDSQKPVA